MEVALTVQEGEALAELAAALGPGTPSGPPPATGSPLRRRYRAVLAGVPERTRRLMLLAAADPDLHPDELALAAGGEPDDIEIGALVTVGASRLDFDPPLLRPIVYAEATLAQRRAAHAALADALHERGQRLRSLLHRAVFPAPDRAAGLARELVAAAPAGPPLLAATALRRATELTGNAGTLVGAARAYWDAGRPHQAARLLHHLPRPAGRPARGPGVVWARARHLAGEVALRRGAAATARDTLLDAAAELAPYDNAAALDAVLLAGDAIAQAGHPGRFAAVVRHALAHAPHGDTVAVHHAAGLAALLSGADAAGFARLRRAVHLAARETDSVTLVRTARAAVLIGDDVRAGELAARAAALARSAGATALVPQALETCAFADLATGHYDAAATAAGEGADLARGSGQYGLAGGLFGILAVLAALVGDRESCHLRIRAARAQDSAARPGHSRALTAWALALLDLVEGRPAATVERLAGEDGNLVVRIAAAPHLLEAATRAAVDLPHAAPDAFDRWSSHTGQPSWLALRARCRALRSPDDEAADQHFREALHRHTPGDFAEAHTQLLYGRNLRHRRRPAAAREHLRRAGETFRLLDAQPWAAQADRELRAAGERIEPYAVPANVALTAQQERIAHLVAGGATNREVAQELHLSPRTIDHHLRNVFTRLGVRSRTELARLITST